jgi:uncharacterized membrane protein
MPLEPADQSEVALDRFGRKYRLSLLITLTIAAALAVWSRPAAINFVIFIVFFWVLAAIIWLMHPVTQVILPKRLLPEKKRVIQGSITITMFLGGCALAGMVLRGENAVSKFVTNSVPGGFPASFIDPTFALVCIIGIWLYTAFRIRK